MSPRTAVVGSCAEPARAMRKSFTAQKLATSAVGEDNTFSWLHSALGYGFWKPRTFSIDGDMLTWSTPSSTSTFLPPHSKISLRRNEMLITPSLTTKLINKCTLQVTSEGTRLTIRFDRPEEAGEWREVLRVQAEEARAEKRVLAPGLEYASSCFLPTNWLEVPLIQKVEYNHNTTIYSFGLPEGQSLNLPVCACLLLRAPGCGRLAGGGPNDYDGSDAIRPYTPMSDNGQLGSFELMIKRYDGGAVSSWLNRLVVGASVSFKHIKLNVKAPYPFEGKQHFAMIAGGSGITPMFQALHAILTTPGDVRDVTLLFSNQTITDVLLKDEISALAQQHPGRFRWQLVDSTSHISHLTSHMS